LATLASVRVGSKFRGGAKAGNMPKHNELVRSKATCPLWIQDKRRLTILDLEKCAEYITDLTKNKVLEHN